MSRLGSHAQPRLSDYGKLGEFLRAFAERKRQAQPTWTMGVWARDMQINNVATLTRIINGERHAGDALCEKFITYFGFSGNEAEYFRHLALVEKNPEGTPLRGYAEDRLRTLRNGLLAKNAEPAPVFAAHSRSLLALWGTVDVAAFNRALEPEGLEAVAQQGRGLSGVTCVRYHDSSIGPFHEAWFCVLAKRLGGRLDKTGFYYRFLFCDQPKVTTYAAMVWGNLHQPATIALHAEREFPSGASIADDAGPIVTLAMSDALPSGPGVEAAPHVYGISNQPHYHSLFLTRLKMFGRKRLFDPAHDGMELHASPLAEVANAFDFQPYSWASYSRVDQEVFGPESL